MSSNTKKATKKNGYDKDYVPIYQSYCNTAVPTESSKLTMSGNEANLTAHLDYYKKNDEKENRTDYAFYFFLAINNANIKAIKIIISAAANSDSFTDIIEDCILSASSEDIPEQIYTASIAILMQAKTNAKCLPCSIL